MAHTECVVIVGAGPAGLAVARALRKWGIDPLVLERGSGPGGAWRTRPDGLRLTGGRRVSHLPGLRYARGTPTFPRRDDVVDYLERYAATLRVRAGVSVRSIAPGDSARWTVTTDDGTVAADDVVVATGRFAEPHVPTLPGSDLWGDRFRHVADYRSPAPFHGTEVLVIGSGTSGMEVASELAEGGARQVMLAVRTPPNLVPRALGALPGLKIMFSLPPRVADSQVRLVQRLTIGDLARYGLPTPAQGPFTTLSRGGREPSTVDPALLTGLRSGRVRVVSAVTALDSDGAVLTDGSRIAADHVIAATGFRPGLEPLVGHLGILDAAGMPTADLPVGLHALGFTGPPGQLPFLGKAAHRIASRIRAGSRAAGPTAAGKTN